MTGKKVAETATKAVAPVAFEAIARASAVVRKGVTRTPMSHSWKMSELTGSSVHFKHELAHYTGSFKERGARYALTMLNDEKRSKGVVAASAGNHAQALAWHGRDLGATWSLALSHPR